jgi:8-oxo-dGTP pyrophosphatase MutT (NUDIX family)
VHVPLPPFLPPPRIGSWRRERAERVATSPIFDVERLHLARPGRSAASPFVVLRIPDWCNVVPLTEDGDLVMVWQYRFGTDALSLETPGGVMDADEAPEAAARRELLEETGYEAAALEHLVSFEPNPAIQNNVCHSFVARGARRVTAPSFDADEECEVVVVPHRHLEALLDGGYVRHGIVVAALERFLRGASRHNAGGPR